MTWIGCAAFGLSLSTYFGSGLQKSPLSFRYFLSALPTAVTEWRHIARDGTASGELSRYFRSHGAQLTDDELRAAFVIPIPAADDRIVFFQGDDLGLPRFVEASFAVFGISLSSPHKLFFLLLGLSTLIFSITYFTEPIALGLLTSVLLAIYAFEFVLTESSQLWTAIDVRFMGVLVIVPCLHLCLAVYAQNWSSRRAIAAAAQSVMMAALYQIRSSSGWALLCAVLIGAFAAGSALAHRRSPRAALRAVVPGLIALAAFLAITELERAHLANRFRTEVPAEHLFWHSIHVGFAVHPDLARDYGLSFDDLPAHRQVFQYLTKTGDKQAVKAVFGGDGSMFDYDAINWRSYEIAARGAVMQIVRDHPKQFAETFLYYKPIMFMKTLFWAAGYYRGPVEVLAMSPTWLKTDVDRRQADAYLRFFRPLAVALYSMAVICMIAGEPTTSTAGALRHGTLVLVAMFAAALVPAFLVYPAFHWLGDTLVVFWTLIYATVALLMGTARRALAGA